MRKLVPRLNYSFGFKDFVFSIYGVAGIRPNILSINAQFASDRVYFVNHARTGIRLLLNSLSLPDKAKIGVQVFNCHTVFDAIRRAGYDPVFIDVDNDLRIAIDDLEKKKKSIDALILTHTFGIPADVESVKRIITDKPIIEDCAHAFLTRYDGLMVGKFGAAAVYSIGKGKFPSIGPGGFIVINNKAMIPSFEKRYLQLLQPRGKDEIINIFKNIALTILHNPLIYKYFTNKIVRSLNNKKDINGHYNHNEKKMLKGNLFLFWKRQPYFEQHLKRQLANQSDILKIVYHGKASPVYNNPHISTNGFMLPILHDNAEQIIKSAKAYGIELGRHFSESINWAKQFGYSLGKCPNAESIVKRIIVLPCHYKYSKKSVDAIIKMADEIIN